MASNTSKKVLSLDANVHTNYPKILPWTALEPWVLGVRTIKCLKLIVYDPKIKTLSSKSRLKMNKIEWIIKRLLLHRCWWQMLETKCVCRSQRCQHHQFDGCCPSNFGLDHPGWSPGQKQRHVSNSPKCWLFFTTGMRNKHAFLVCVFQDTTLFLLFDLNQWITYIYWAEFQEISTQNPYWNNSHY